MSFATKTRTEQILQVMLVLAWIAFIGLLVEAGAILFSYVVTCFNPEGAKNLYKGLNFYSLRQDSIWHYTQFVSFMVALPAMKAYMVYLVIQMLSKVNLANPFKMEVAQLLEKISYVLGGIWFVSWLGSTNAQRLHEVTEMYKIEVQDEFLFVAGLVFIISQIFKRGVEIQSENELTV